jgi:hypothetical protein
MESHPSIGERISVKHKPGTAYVTPVGGNIFADLGFDTEEAVTLLMNSRQRIAMKTGRVSCPENLPIEQLRIAPRTAVILRAHGVGTLKSICRLSSSDLRLIPGIGRQRAREILDALVEGGGGLMPPYTPEMFGDPEVSLREKP